MPDILDYFGAEPLTGLPWDRTRQAGTGILGYLQDVVSGKMAASGPVGQASYDPNKSFRENVLNPQAQEAAMSMVGPLAIRAFHGSPFDFSRFSLGKIGTGQGAQTYGHGLYFAEAEDVARGYREGLAGLPTQSLIGPGGETLATGRPVQFADKIKLSDIMPPDMPFLGNSIKRLWTEGREIDVPSVIKEAWGGLELPESVKPKITAAVENAIERAKPVLSQYRIETTRPGHMYEVDIHADPQRLLDWDKPLREQGQQVRNIVAGRTDWASPDMPGSRFYDAFAKRIANERGTGNLVNHGFDYEGASDTLNQFGIPGVRYLDEFSRGAGQGTSNYVVFNDKLIDILRKYGIVPPLAGAGALAAGSEPPT